MKYELLRSKTGVGIKVTAWFNIKQSIKKRLEGPGPESEPQQDMAAVHSG